MIQQLRDAWVAALRSDMYIQTRGRLHSRTSKDEDCYCAFGVLLKIDPEIVGIGCDEAVTQDGKMVKLEELTNRYEIKSVPFKNIISFNDGGMSFEELADYIEREVA